MEWNEWIGKGIFIRTIRNKVYSGKVIDADSNFLKVNDKFGNAVTIAILEIAEIKEEGEHENNT